MDITPENTQRCRLRKSRIFERYCLLRRQIPISRSRKILYISVISTLVRQLFAVGSALPSGGGTALKGQNHDRR